LGVELVLAFILPPRVFRRFSHLPQRSSFSNCYSISPLSGCFTSKIQKRLFLYFNVDLVISVDSSAISNNNSNNNNNNNDYGDDDDDDDDNDNDNNNKNNNNNYNNNN